MNARRPRRRLHAQQLDTGRRLRRLRWSLTLMFTLVTATCLITLTAVASRIDASSRLTALDGELNLRAAGLSRAVWIDAGTLHLEPLKQDTLAVGPGAVVVAEVSPTGVVTTRWTSGTVGDRPRLDDLRELAARVVRDQAPELMDGKGLDGGPMRFGAAPVWGEDVVGAVVVVAGDPAPGENGHGQLVRWLLAGCLALVCAAALAGHLLSGRSIRPALRTLQRQERFLADAAHELRTPLSALRLAAEAGTRDAAHGPDALRQVVRLSDHLGRLVTGLLTRARVQGGSQQIERIPMRLDLLVEQVLDDLPHSGVELTVAAPAPVVILGDPDLISLAVRNLLVNAFQHGATSDGRVQVEVGVSGAGVTVRDHGQGIGDRTPDRLMAHGVTGTGAGTGIGLALVRWVADLHDGEVRLQRPAGGGVLAELDLHRTVVGRRGALTVSS